MEKNFFVLFNFALSNAYKDIFLKVAPVMLWCQFFVLLSPPGMDITQRLTTKLLSEVRLEGV